MITPRQWERYEQLRQRGWNRAAAAREVGVDRVTAWRREKDLQTINPKDRPSAAELVVPGPIALGDLRPEAKRGLEDFAFFQRRYFGRIATPWQVEAAVRMVELLASPVKEFVVVNAPPGCGKSTLFTLDIPAWLTCRDRAIRGQIGSKAESKAKMYVGRLRRAFERTLPLLGKADEVAQGLAFDADATLSDDYGSFKPETRDVWAASGFVVAQHGNVLISEKEPTWSAYGMDSGYVGLRFNFIVWDDLVDMKVLRTAESRENAKQLWDAESETRLEPAGVLVLQGQRLGPDDLYRYNLDKRVLPDDDDADISEQPAMYHHIVFQAHYEDRCQKQHSLTAPYYPDGCLLDPRRLSWRDLRQKMANTQNFAVLYQQEDVDPEDVLVDPLWIIGGTDPRTGEVHPGCVDKDRGLCQLAPGLHGQLLSVATADPSPTKYWCLTGGTLVLTRRGEIPIRSVVPGDYAMTRGGWKRVEGAGQTGVRRVRSLGLSNGRVLRITEEHRVLTPTGWTEAADLVARPPAHVLGVGGDHQVVGVDTRRVLAQMVDLQTVRNRLAPENQDTVGQPMGQAFTVGGAPHYAVPTTTPGDLGAGPGPFPASARGLAGTVTKEPEVWCDLSAGGYGPIPAGHTDLAAVVDDGVPALTDVHVVSITAESHEQPVYDLQVEDMHEFVAEGVVVHNSIQWWVVRFADGQPQERYLLDQIRQPMTAPDFLDWNNATQTFSGVMEDWQARSNQLQLPITCWVVEENAAQRFLLQYEHVRRWMGAWRVRLIPHNTNTNKTSTEFGVQTLSGVYRHGLVRLPGKQRSGAHNAVQWLVSEVTHYSTSGKGGWKSDDCVMAQWFLEFNLPKLAPRTGPMKRLPRPTWLSRADTYAHRREMIAR